MIRIGAVGAGNILNKHVKQLAGSSEAGIVAVTDLNDESVAAAIEKYFPGQEIGGYTDATEMYAKENLDAVIIASPHTLHYGQAVQALDAGCHVFLEKPMTTSSVDAKALAAKAEAAPGRDLGEAGDGDRLYFSELDEGNRGDVAAGSRTLWWRSGI
jgi:predicted dehydrogenase